MEMENRPWGKYTVLLDDEKKKVKEITVIPGGQLSLQYHHRREEVWTIVEGTGIVTLGDEEITCKYGDVIRIAKEEVHSIRNENEDSNLKFIEVQLGDYFGEDDIVRISDIYGR